jgi:hypothetical protein
MPRVKHKVGIFFVFSFFTGMGMSIGAATVTQCLSAIGVPQSPNCNWRGNPLALAVEIGGVVLVAFGFWVMLFRKPPRTAKPDPSVPDEDGFYPLRNQIGKGLGAARDTELGFSGQGREFFVKDDVG